MPICFFSSYISCELVYLVRLVSSSCGRVIDCKSIGVGSNPITPLYTLCVKYGGAIKLLNPAKAKLPLGVNIYKMVAIVLKIFAILVPLLISIAYLTLAERKVLGYIQCRKGPNVVGVYGILQPIADGLKLFTKEIIIPNHANNLIYILAPILSLSLAFVAWGVIPYGAGVVLSDLGIGILYLFAVSSISVYAILMSGWSSNSKYAFLGAIRAAAQMISYEVSIGLIIISVILCVGSLNLTEIVLTQNHT